VNEAWVKEFLQQNQDPLLQTFKATPNIAIAGVVRDARQNLSEPARPQIDSSFSHLSQKNQQNIGSLSVYLFIRTSVPPLSIIPQLRDALHNVAPTIAFQTPSTMEDFLDDALVTNRMESWLFGIFAGIAVLLAVVGIHGLLMQEVASRIRDIGVRMALGATRAGIAQMILTRISALLGIGLGTGTLIMLLVRRVVSSVVTVQYSRDGLMIAALIALLAAIGLLAALAPTRRATSIDPIQALRME
jgi:putative ABC transport system permease protein